MASVQNTVEMLPETGARIGPNALIQTVRVLRESHSGDCVQAILRRSGQPWLLTETPETMVDEREFARLVRALSAELGVQDARGVLQQAGLYTADYLLAHRIPGFFQVILRALPPRPALRLLLGAIRQHAWTFIGSGTFDYDLADVPVLTVTCSIQPGEAACGFYAGTFLHLFQTLIHKQADLIIETEPLSESQTLCRYTVQLG